MSLFIFYAGVELFFAYFSAKMVSEGCYVIPVLSSCVYHINHQPRSGSLEKKRKEALKNYNTYIDLLNKPWKQLSYIFNFLLFNNMNSKNNKELYFTTYKEINRGDNNEEN